MAFPLPETNLFRFLLVLCINYSWFRKLMEMTVGLSLKTTSMTDDVIDWPLPNKIIDCASTRESYYFGYDKKWFHVRNIKSESKFEYVYQKLLATPIKKENNSQVENHCRKP